MDRHARNVSGSQKTMYSDHFGQRKELGEPLKSSISTMKLDFVAVYSTGELEQKVRIAAVPNFYLG